MTASTQTQDMHKQHQLALWLNQDKVVKNFTSRALAQKGEEALALGLNFAVAPQQIPSFEITCYLVLAHPWHGAEACIYYIHGGRFVLGRVTQPTVRTLQL